MTDRQNKLVCDCWSMLQQFHDENKLFFYCSFYPKSGVIWYFYPHGKLTLGSISIHDILTPLYGKLNPHDILTPSFLIKRQTGESKYHGQGAQNTMDRGFDIPWVGGQHTMGRGSKYHGYGVRYTMDKGFNIPWVGGLIYHGQGVLSTMGRGFKIPSKHTKVTENYIK